MSKQDRGPDKDGKIQFVFVNVEGNQDTLQTALHQVGEALNRGMNPQIRTIIAVPTKKLPGDTSTNGEKAEEFYEVQLEEVENATAENGTSYAASNVNKPKKERKAPPTPAILKDFDPNDGSPSFLEYVKTKNTSTQINKYLVIAAWFKKHGETEEIGPSHIYTCFQLMKWDAPDDMGQPFRNMKKNDSYVDNGTKKNLWKITIVGLNEVDRLDISNMTEG